MHASAAGSGFSVNTARDNSVHYSTHNNLKSREEGLVHYKLLKELVKHTAFLRTAPTLSSSSQLAIIPFQGIWPVLASTPSPTHTQKNQGDAYNRKDPGLVPASTWRPTMIHNSSSEHLAPSSGLLGHHVHTWHTGVHAGKHPRV